MCLCLWSAVSSLSPSPLPSPPHPLSSLCIQVRTWGYAAGTAKDLTHCATAAFSSVCAPTVLAAATARQWALQFLSRLSDKVNMHIAHVRVSMYLRVRKSYE